MTWGGAAVDFVVSATSSSVPTPSPNPTATVGSGDGPLVVIGLAVITLFGTAVTAMAPTLLELAKRKSGGGQPPPPSVATSAPPLSPDPAPASTQVVSNANAGISMVEQAFSAALDFRQQRDDAVHERDSAAERLRRAEDYIRRQESYIQSLEVRLGISRGDNAPLGSQPRVSGQRWEPR